MAHNAVFWILSAGLALLAYAAAAYAWWDAADRRLRTQGRRLVALYVERANLMPRLLNAARKHMPVPSPLYLRFVAARDRFAASIGDAGIREANAELDTVFADFFEYYAMCRLPAFSERRDEFDRLQEKIAFAKLFYEKAAAYKQRVATGPCRPAVVCVARARKASGALVNRVKRLIKK